MTNQYEENSSLFIFCLSPLKNKNKTKEVYAWWTGGNPDALFILHNRI